MYDKEFPEEEILMKDDVNPTTWKNFWNKHQKYHTICLACLAKSRDDVILSKRRNNDLADSPLRSMDEEVFGPVQLNAASKAILLNWYRQAQQRRASKLALKKRRQVVADVSDDEEEAMAVSLHAPWANATLSLSQSSTKIAMKWLQEARLGIYEKKQRK